MSEIVRHTLTSNYTDTDFPFFLWKVMVAGMGGLLYFSYLPGIYEDRRWPRPGWLQVFVFAMYLSYLPYTRTGIGRVRAGCRFFLLPALFLLLPWFFRSIFLLAYIFCVTHRAGCRELWDLGFVFVTPLGSFLIFFCVLTLDWLQDLGDLSVSLDPKEWSNSLR